MGSLRTLIWGDVADSLSVLPLKKVKREAAVQRRPTQSERKTAFFPRNDRPHGLQRKAFQTEKLKH